MARSIRRPVDELTVMTKALGSGEPLGRFVGGLRELDLVGDGLRTASAALVSHQEHLEDMVMQRTQELARVNNQLMAEIEARKQAQATLLQTQKMEAIGQLTGGIAHDFNNLLTIALGSLEMLEPRISDERSLDLLRNVQGAMLRGAKLTGSLLAFARKQRLEVTLADLNSLIVALTELLQRSIGPFIEIRNDLATELWPLLIDVGQIETALLNVAINACDAMPWGGTLLIKTANISDELPEEVAGRECVLMSLHDTGIGMSPETLERAFEPFFTTKGVGKGTGLGLSMVFGVVRQSGGAVRLRSSIGQGTTVQIYLPRAEDAVLLREKSTVLLGARDTVAEQILTSASARILVVDDDLAVRRVIVESLRGIGYSVVEADSGGAALAILERDDPCDLVVLDQVMPGLSGEETARSARRTRPDLKVLFITGYSDVTEYGTEVDHDIWLKKPFTAEALARAVSTTLERDQ